jgi:DNA polymerase-1
MNKILLIDGHNLLFRMFYGMPSSIRNKQGRDIKGTFGFLGSLKKLVDLFTPDQLIVVFDSETSTSSRLEEDSEYKQNRIDYSELPEDENPFTQLKYIFQVLDYLSIFYHEARDCEADDYIASICEQLKIDNELVIVSMDKDFLQLVEPQVLVYNPVSDIYYTPEKVVEKFGITPEQMIDYKILVGDPSDNIKGVPSIGPKTAAKILKNGTLLEIINQEIEIEERLFNKLNEHQAVIEKNRTLITMVKNIEFKLDEALLAVNKQIQRKTKDILIDCGVY